MRERTERERKPGHARALGFSTRRFLCSVSSILFGVDSQRDERAASAIYVMVSVG